MYISGVRRNILYSPTQGTPTRRTSAADELNDLQVALLTIGQPSLGEPIKDRARKKHKVARSIIDAVTCSLSRTSL